MPFCAGWVWITGLIFKPITGCLIAAYGLVCKAAISCCRYSSLRLPRTTGWFFGLDDTIERRRGDLIAAKSIYRDPVRSSLGHFVKASGVRWLSLMLLVPVSWADRIWALPFLTVLCPSERYYQARGRAHQPLLERAQTDAASASALGAHPVA